MDNRNSARRRVLKAGTISYQNSGIECTVHDISLGGANLEVESSSAIPDSFDLLIDAESGKLHCHVVWRKERRIGVAFE